MFQRIVVPLDGSELAERALPQAEELARLTGAPIHLVRVIDITAPLRYSAYGWAIETAGLESLLDDERASARAYLERIGRDVDARGVAVTTELREGLPARELIETAGSGDLVVMASHGRGGLARWFLGSVAAEVVRRSAAPVVLVRSAPEDADAGGREASAAPTPEAELTIGR